MKTTKKQYQSPELKKFGKVSEVTQTSGGAGNISDTVAGGYTS